MDKITDLMPAMDWLMLGFLVPAVYLAGILAVTATAARTLAWPALARLPVALIAMHLAWGLGFLTSPRSLIPGHPRAPAPQAGPLPASGGP